MTGKKRKKPVIGLTLGDAAGIGAEIMAKAAAKEIFTEKAQPLIIGDERLLNMGMKIAGISFDYKKIENPDAMPEDEGILLLDTKSVDMDKLVLGSGSAINGKEEGDRLLDCIRLCKKRILDGFCYAPLNKSCLKMGGYNFASEHELLAHYYGTKNYFSEMNVVGNLWNIRVTSHIPLKDVCKNITVPGIMDVALLGYETLRRAGIETPRFAMAAVNPHAGDNGTCGTEEIEILQTAIEQLKEKGISVEGPFAADTLFIRAFRGDFDGVITMYHDQGQIAIKLKDFERGVTVGAGLPNPITTPAHGTAYDIAGAGLAISSNMEYAYTLAVQMAEKEVALL